MNNLIARGQTYKKTHKNPRNHGVQVSSYRNKPARETIDFRLSDSWIHSIKKKSVKYGIQISNL